MEKKLKKMFDYQRFENCASLQKLIDDTEKRTEELDDSALAQVYAAGNVMTARMEKHDVEKTEQTLKKSF